MHRLLLFAFLLPLAAEAQEVDPQYQQAFNAAFPPVDPPADWATYATAERFDSLYLAEGWDANLASLHNDSGGIAWGTSYQMMALNGMYSATRDTKYLDANRKVIRAVLAVTDDKRGKILGDGRAVPAWGCEQYSKAGRAVHAVHTGIISAPIFEFLLNARGNTHYREQLDEEFNSIADAALAALRVHDGHWHDGPGENEGHYKFTPFEDGDAKLPLPGNWQSAMGWAWYKAGKALDKQDYIDRGVKLGAFIRNRLSPTADGAYYWPYQLPLEPTQGEIKKADLSAEDTSHAGLTMALPFALGKDGVLFTPEDLTRLGNTVVQGFAPHDNGVLYPTINGKPGLDPASYISFPSRWLWLARYVPQVEDRLAAFYTRHKATPAALELADILEWRAK